MGERIGDRESEVLLHLTQDEATDLFFRCLSSPGDDTALSERVLGKLAKALASASECELRMAA